MSTSFALPIGPDDFVLGQWLTTGPHCETSTLAYGSAREKCWHVVTQSLSRATGDMSVTRSRMPGELSMRTLWNQCEDDVDKLLAQGQRFVIALQVESCGAGALLRARESVAKIWQAMQSTAAPG